MRFADFLDGIGGYVAFHPRMTKFCGSTNANVFLSNMFAWSGHGKDPDGWIYKSSEDIEFETGLSYKEQAAARRLLVSRGFIEEKHRRFEHRMYFRVDKDRISDAWESQNPDFANCPKVNSGNAQRSVRETTGGQFDLLDPTLPTIHQQEVDAGKEKNVAKYQEFMDLWNSSIEGTPFPKIYTIAGKRSTTISARLKAYPNLLEMMPDVIRYMASTDWYIGKNDRGWVASFDYIMQDGKMCELYEKSKADIGRAKSSELYLDTSKPWNQAPKEIA